MIICRCSICDYEWGYDDDTNESLIRASCAPCGHQGMFKLRKTENKKENKNES